MVHYGGILPWLAVGVQFPKFVPVPTLIPFLKREFPITIPINFQE